MPQRPQTACSSLVSTRGLLGNTAASECESGVSESLSERRAKLRQMILSETSLLSEKLRNKPISEGTSAIRKRQLEILREKQQKIKAKKEAERKERAAKLMYEQFK